MTPPPSSSKCQSLYWYLLGVIDADIKCPSTDYIRAWKETEECDGIGKDLEDVRDEIARNIGRFAINRIHNHYETDVDGFLADGYLSRFGKSNRKELLGALSFKDRMHCHTFHKINNKRGEYLFSAILGWGIIGVCALGAISSLRTLWKTVRRGKGGGG